MADRPVTEVTRKQPVRPVAPERERQPGAAEINQQVRGKKPSSKKPKPKNKIDDFA